MLKGLERSDLQLIRNLCGILVVTNRGRNRACVPEELVRCRNKAAVRKCRSALGASEHVSIGRQPEVA